MMHKFWVKDLELLISKQLLRMSSYDAADIFTHFWHMMFGKHPTWTNGEEVSDDILFPGAPLSGDCNAE